MIAGHRSPIILLVFIFALSLKALHLNEFFERILVMPNIALVLKAEIRRVARREIRLEYDALKKQVHGLKKTVRTQAQAIAKLEKSLATMPAQSDPAELEDPAPKATTARVSPMSIKRQRKRLKLSQSELGQLLKVSTNTIVRWEAGTSKPRPIYRDQLVNLRGMGIRNIRKMLAT